MTNKPMLVLGMMSGTSVDGIDISLVRISGAPPNLQIKLLNHTAIAFPAAVRKEILRLAEQNPISSGELSQLHFRLGHIYADAALAACKKFRVSPRKIRLIGNHGQTIFHQGNPVPYLGAKTSSTLQIGEGSIIAARTGITTVSDFRPADLALGGNGAPLVPFADYALYRHPKVGRISLNIGGIANITVIPANAKPSQVFAFDTGPGNMLIDALVSHFTHGRQRFDKNAALARKGRSTPALLDELLRDPYLKLSPPKSTGREYYGAAYVKKLLVLGKKHRAQPNDIIRAATLFTAISIVDALNRFVLPKNKIRQLIVSGGGAQNPLLLTQLSAALGPQISSPVGTRYQQIPGSSRNIGSSSHKLKTSSKIEVLPSSELNVPTDAKESLAFALLAYETFHHRPSNIPSATGARGPAILGKISYAPPR
jgi:anhydro-N-acetylmuramic acid kinase